MNCSIVGYGHVGKAMHALFKDAVIYDEPLKIGKKDAVNETDVAFVCVPTPESPDGSCNTAIVESVIAWLETRLIIIRSTVPVGFTESMVKKYKKKIVFQPEYYGETVNHPFSDLRNQNWLSFGGETDSIDIAIQLYQQVLNSNIKINMADSNSVEFAKYMTNSFLATKVTFCNEMYDLANKLGVNYNQAREIWLCDPRIGRSHTFVYPENRGFGGSCLPKDLSAIIYQADEANIDVTLLKNVKEKNKLYQ